MGKKLFSLCMALVLCLGLLPVTALAAGEIKLFIGGQQITKSGCYEKNQDGDWTKVEGSGGTEPASGQFSYDAATFTLTLNQAEITHDQTVNVAEGYTYDGSVIAFSQTADVSLKIVVSQGTSTITGTGGIRVESTTGNASLSIKGPGSLDVKPIGSNSGITLSSSKNTNLDIDGADVTASSLAQHGVYLISSTDASSTSTITVNNGSLTTGGNGYVGIYYYWSGTSNAGTSSLTVSGNAVVDTRNSRILTNNEETVVQVGAGSDGNGGIVFDGKSGTVYGDVTLDESLTIGSEETLTIPEGSSLNANGKLTNNGTILASGGTVTGNLSSGAAVTTPSITAQPTGQTVTEGSAAEFSVTASAGDSETLTYQWQQSTDSGSSWTDISGATSADYTTETTTTSMDGYQYRCVVTSASGVSVISQAATLTVQVKPAPVSVTGVSLDKATLELFTGGSATLTATVQPDDATNKNVTWKSDNANVATVQNGTVNAVGAGEATITVTTEDGNKTATCAVTVEKPYTPPPYIPPTKTPSEQAIDKIEDAKEGSTVKITLRTGQTKLDKEVFEELAGRDVTLEISLPGGVTWTVNGEDIPQTADLTDLDMGVSLNTSTIPVDLINAITGEIGTVQITLKHDGPFGFTMTLTAPVGKENEGLWANLYHYDEDAEEMVYQTAALVDEDGNAALPFDHASQYALVLDSKSHDLPFTDLAANAWYTDAVAYVYRHDIMEGMSATTFQPNGTLTRAMAVQIFYNLEGQPDISDENLGYPYEDVDAQAWYGDAVYWARITGVATGYGDGTFQPGDSITRQEFAQMLYNYAKYKGYDLTAAGDLSTFPDAGSIADWAKVAMSWANGNELINGHDDGTIDAAGIGTRAQAASILMRFDQNLVEK